MPVTEVFCSRSLLLVSVWRRFWQLRSGSTMKIFQSLEGNFDRRIIRQAFASRFAFIASFFNFFVIMFPTLSLLIRGPLPFCALDAPNLVEFLSECSCGVGRIVARSLRAFSDFPQTPIQQCRPSSFAHCATRRL